MKPYRWLFLGVDVGSDFWQLLHQFSADLDDLWSKDRHMHYLYHLNLLCKKPKLF